MLAPPDDLRDVEVVDALAASWLIDVAAIRYEAVGSGSHHWVVADERGDRWFVTVDERDTSGRLELYRLTWDVGDISAYVDRFRRPHADDPNTRKAWTEFDKVVTSPRERRRASRARSSR